MNLKFIFRSSNELAFLINDLQTALTNEKLIKKEEERKKEDNEIDEEQLLNESKEGRKIFFNNRFEKI